MSHITACQLRRALALTIPAVLLGAPAYAANTVGTDASDTDARNTFTDAIIVTGYHARTPLTLSTDPRDPRQPVPAADGAGYLKTIPGFSVVRKGGVSADPLMRGMGGSRLMM